MVTRKEMDDRQKMDFKARLVALCFQEKMKPQLDNPTVGEECLNTMMEIISNTYIIQSCIS